MPSIRFTKNIQRHVSCPDRTISGETVREVLEGYFEVVPGAKSYVLDERGGLRQHMVIFVNGVPIRDRADLSDAVQEEDAVDIFQALSGG